MTSVFVRNLVLYVGCGAGARTGILRRGRKGPLTPRLLAPLPLRNYLREGPIRRRMLENVVFRWRRLLGQLLV